MTDLISRAEVIATMSTLFPACPRAKTFCDALDSGYTVEQAKTAAMRVDPATSTVPLHRYDAKAPVDREARLRELSEGTRAFNAARGYSRTH